MAPRQRFSSHGVALADQDELPPPPASASASAVENHQHHQQRQRNGPASDNASSDKNTLLKKSPSTNGSAVDSTTVSTEEADQAREQHDIFNLWALPFVIGSTVINWNWIALFHGYGPSVAYTGTYFWWNWDITVLYFIVDLMWVATVPHCVKSPGTIIKHHCVVLAYMVAPIVFWDMQWFMGACLSVEINTWFLIARRVVYKRKESGNSYIPDVVVTLVNVLFYVSWILIRIIVYPAILVVFLVMAVQLIRETGRFFHWPMIFIPVHFILCVLNLKWSYDLFWPMIFPSAAASSSTGGLGTKKISNGL